MLLLKCAEKAHSKMSLAKNGKIAKMLCKMSKNTAIPLAYEDMQRFVEELSKSAGISPLPIPGYDTIQKDESE